MDADVPGDENTVRHVAGHNLWGGIFGERDKNNVGG